MDCGQAEEISQRYDIRGFPSIKGFGKDKKKPEDYQGAREEAALVAHVEENAKGFSCSADTATLKYKHVHGFLVNAKKRPQFILFGGKQAPDWYSGVAGEYINGKKKKADFGFVDGTSKDGQKIAKRFGITTKGKGGKAKGALLAFHGVKKGDNSVYIQMAGKLKQVSAENFAKEVIGRSAKDVEKLTSEKKAKKTPSFPPPSVPRKKAPTSLSELTTAKIGERKCFKQSKMCLLVLLPGEGDADAEGDVETTLRALAKKYRNDPISFVWVRGQSEYNSQLRSHFDDSDSAEGAKIMALKTGKRPRFVEMEGSGASVEKKGVTKFVDSVLGGGATFKRMEALPSLS